MPAGDREADNPTDPTALVALVAGLLRDMEGRLVAKMDDNSRHASERWAKHDADAARTLREIEERFSRDEEAFAAHLVVANAHFSREHDRELVIDARVKPIRGIAQYTAANWRTILLVVLALLALFGLTSDTLTHIAQELGLR